MLLQNKLAFGKKTSILPHHLTHTSKSERVKDQLRPLNLSIQIVIQRDSCSPEYGLGASKGNKREIPTWTNRAEFALRHLGQIGEEICVVRASFWQNGPHADFYFEPPFFFVAGFLEASGSEEISR